MNNGVQGEIDNLERVFVRDYGFSTELYLIPSQDSQPCLQRKIFFLQEEHDSRNEPLVVYYGEHGLLMTWIRVSGPSESDLAGCTRHTDQLVGATVQRLIGSQSSISSSTPHRMFYSSSTAVTQLLQISAPSMGLWKSSQLAAAR